MRKGTVVSFKNFKPAIFIAQNNILIILVAMILAGIAAGTFSVSRVGILSDYAASYTERFISLRSGSSFFGIAFNSFMSGALILLVTFAAGTSMLGVILVPVFTCFRGVLYGGVSSFLYAEYGVKGIAFNTVLIIPSAIIFIISLILAARESVKFSLLIAKMSLPGGMAVNLSFDFKNYCGRYLFICLISLASALVDAVLSCSFLGSLTL